MKHKVLILTLSLYGMICEPARAANEGKITSINFAGEDMTSHSNVVQIQIEGGFSAGSCNTTFAAIRKKDEHLVSAALSAYAMSKPIKAWLNENDSYYPSQNRCVITMLTF